jgi:hypothetical protein
MVKRKSLIPLPQHVADALARTLDSLSARVAADDPWRVIEQRATEAAARTGSGRRFPAPWTYEEKGESFVIMDANGRKIAYVYFDDGACEVRRMSASA